MPHRSSIKRGQNQGASPLTVTVKMESLAPTPDLPQAAGITSEKNPAAVLLGRLGGLKGGPARAKKLDKATRSEIAKKAALARWRSKDGEKQKAQASGDIPKV
jgi:hypothetical protein